MFDLISIELYKISRKPRSFIGFGAITVIVLIIELALLFDGQSYIQFIIQQVEQTFQIEGKIINGNLVAYVILQTLIIQMPHDARRRVFLVGVYRTSNQTGRL